jgi:hypothetical protein
MALNVGTMDEPTFCNVCTKLVVEMSTLAWNKGSRVVCVECQRSLAPLVIPKEALVATFSFHSLLKILSFTTSHYATGMQLVVVCNYLGHVCNYKFGIV